MKKENSFALQIIIEIIAIFTGITLALIIDQFKENSQSISETKNHFNLIVNEFSKDSIELNEIENLLEEQKHQIDLMSFSLKDQNDSLFNQQLALFEAIPMYNTRIDEVNLILNSNSFSKIYNDTIFGYLNNLKSDCKTFEFIQKHEYQLIKEIKDVFILPYLDYDTQLIDTKSMTNKNLFLNKLKEYRNLIKEKNRVIGSMISSTNQCINDMKSVIN